MNKPLWKSKTIWSAALLVAFGILKYYQVQLPYEAIMPALVAGIGYGIRDAIKEE